MAKKTKKKITKKAAKKTAKKITKKTAKKTTKKPAKKVAKKTTKRPTNKTAKKVTKKITKKLNKKVSKKVTKKTEKKETKKVSKKSVKKTVAKKPTYKTIEKSVQDKKDTQTKKQEAESVVIETPAKAVVNETPEKKEVIAQVNIPVEGEIVDEIKENIAEEVINLARDYSLDDIFASLSELDLFQSDNDDCIEKGCDNPATTSGYCRLHYIANWTDIKERHEILSEGKLQSYIQDLVNKYPIKQIETILQDLSTDKKFFGVLKELNLDGDEIDFDDISEDVNDDDMDIAFEAKRVGGGPKAGFDDEEEAL
ncbi:MAG: hypothetical protein H6622_18105 [Halobacteriovoraceae bacterium]|nr:hypothetical protein [Halobacteriovoraceae bacterium]